MYDINGKLALINLILWVFLLICYSLKSNRTHSTKKGYFCFYILSALFSTFAFAEADTYHYHEIYDQMLIYNESIHVEEFYYQLIKFLPANYYVWRFVVWGTALMILIHTLRRLKIDSTFVYLVFPVILLQQFAVTRGCLGIAVFLMSVSYIINPNPRYKIISIILGYLFAVISLFLHQSLIIFAIIFLFALIPITKNVFFILLLAYPIIRAIILPYTINLLGTGFFDDETVSFATHYLNSEQSVANINGIIRMIVEYIPRLLVFYFLIKQFVFRQNEYPRVIRIMFQYSFVLFYIALLFWGQETSSFVTNRTIHLMCFPLMITLTYILTQYRTVPKYMKLVLFSFVFSDLYAFSYTIVKTW